MHKSAKTAAISSIMIFCFLYPNSSFADQNGAISAAKWCLDDATKKIKDQPLSGRGRECRKWLAKYGFRSQKELAVEATFLAKGGDSAGAIERINVCQCHNEEARRDVISNQSAVIDYLKTR